MLKILQDYERKRRRNNFLMQQIVDAFYIGFQNNNSLLGKLRRTALKKIQTQTLAKKTSNKTMVQGLTSVFKNVSLSPIILEVSMLKKTILLCGGIVLSACGTFGGSSLNESLTLDEGKTWVLYSMDDQLVAANTRATVTFRPN